MEKLSDPGAPTPRPSATVLLLRDGAPGLEVYMLRRHERSSVLGGAHVFPGGKLDREDCEEAALCTIGGPRERLHEMLGEPDGELATSAGLFYAACRETFEEARVLLARDATPASGRIAEAIAGERAWSMLRAGLSFCELLTALELQIDTEALVPWSRWITPRVPSMTAGRRFDTRFFVAALPAGQSAGIDDHEAVHGEWLNPGIALRRYADGEVTLGPPQIMSLLQLAACRSAAEVLDAARLRKPALIEPEPFQLDGRRVVCYPGDTHHPVAERAMLGPTRLIQRDGRFEPPGGIEELLSLAAGR